MVIGRWRLSQQSLATLAPADIAYLAGLFEGEGCFSTHRSKWKGAHHTLITKQPRCQLAMTDRDVVERVAMFLGTRLLGPYENNRQQEHHIKDNKPMFMVSMTGNKAKEFIQMIYPLLGERRRQRIDEMLAECGSERVTHEEENT